MCLMCEPHLASCSVRACVEAAKLRAEAAREAGGSVYGVRNEYFQSRTMDFFLWTGASDEPCEHIKADHGPDCTVVKKSETEYGFAFDTCNCDPDELAGWVYY